MIFSNQHSSSIFKWISTSSLSSFFLSPANQLQLSPFPCLPNSLKIAAWLSCHTGYVERQTQDDKLYLLSSADYIDLICVVANKINSSSELRPPLARPLAEGVQLETRCGESVALFTWPQAAINVYQMCNAQSSRGSGAGQQTNQVIYISCTFCPARREVVAKGEGGEGKIWKLKNAGCARISSYPAGVGVGAGPGVEVNAKSSRGKRFQFPN